MKKYARTNHNRDSESSTDLEYRFILIKNEQFWVEILRSAKFEFKQ